MIRRKGAKEAGADFWGGGFGSENRKAEIKIDRVISTDMMAIVGKLGKVLGPKGLMPNPKLGTVTADLKKIIEDIKNGLIEFKADKEELFMQELVN